MKRHITINLKKKNRKPMKNICPTHLNKSLHKHRAISSLSKYQKTPNLTTAENPSSPCRKARLVRGWGWGCGKERLKKRFKEMWGK